MCGIAGFFSPQKNHHFTEKHLNSAIKALKHRGPDGDDFFLDSHYGVSHTRLAIQDLSSSSKQPALTAQSVLAYNGEIYNFKELNSYLCKKYGVSTQHEGDLKTLHLGLDLEGLSFIDKLNGDFAISLYDLKTRQLTLIRDRLGVKPLYYTIVKDQLLFASEIRAFKAFEVPIYCNSEQLHDYLAFRYTRGNETVFEGIQKLAPGTLLIFDQNMCVQTKTYWNPTEAFKQSQNDLESLLDNSIFLRQRAKVPVGVLLSGGIDSGLILKKANDNNKNIKAFTCQMGELNHLDFQQAQQQCAEFEVQQIVYEHNNDHTAQAILTIEEPIGDSIIDPLYGLLQHSSTHVTVLLSGEGADEVFGGYGHHYFLTSVHKLFPLTRKIIHFLLNKRSLRILNKLNSVYPLELKTDELIKIKAVINNSDSFVEMYHQMCEFLSPQERKAVLNTESKCLKTETYKLINKHQNLSFIKKLILLELKTWLPNYNLLKLDKLSSQFSMEARVPYLDHRIVETLLNSDDSMLFSYLTKKPAIYKMAKKNKPIHINSKIPFTYVKTNQSSLIKTKKNTIQQHLNIWKGIYGF